MNQPLIRFAEAGSAVSIEQLVRSHTDAVYSQSLRQLRDPALAEEATQTVFITLARKANRIPQNTIMAGWLFNTTRHCCATLRRSEARRRKHERNAMNFRAQERQGNSNDLHADAESRLNDALEKLRARDRDAILLRYFQGHTMREVGVALGVSEDAAKQQVSRALEKLRQWFAGQGLAVPAGVIVTWMETAVKPAPAHLIPKLVVVHLTKPAILWPWLGSKVAASVLAGAVITAGAATAVITLADAGSTPPPAAPVKAVDNSQATPIATLRKLAKALHDDDRPAIDGCLTSSAGDPDVTTLIKLEAEEDAAWAHVQRASMTAFKIKDLPLQHFGFNCFPFMDGGFEVMFDKMLEATPPPQTTIEGDVAKVKINLSPALFGGTGPNRDRAQERWSGAMLVFKNINNQWNLDTHQTINMLDHVQAADPNANGLRIEQRLDGMINDAMEDVAGKIESGELASAKAAGDVLDRTVMDAFVSCHVTSFSVALLPVIGGN